MQREELKHATWLVYAWSQEKAFTVLDLYYPYSLLFIFF